eukprot:SAG31_NODE_11088_length_1067_cov_1.273760_1_plen_39_part_10
MYTPPINQVSMEDVQYALIGPAGVGLLVRAISSALSIFK